MLRVRIKNFSQAYDQFENRSLTAAIGPCQYSDGMFTFRIEVDADITQRAAVDDAQGAQFEFHGFVSLTGSLASIILCR